MTPRRKAVNSKIGNGRSGRHWRIYFLVLFVLAASAVIIFRLYLLQVRANDHYDAIAQNQHQVMTVLNPKRGEIFLQDRGGLYPLAVNKEMKLVYAVPQEIENPGEASIRLASLFKMEEKELFDKLNRPDDRYEILQHRLSEDDWNKLSELNIKGIYSSPEWVRFYPAGELAAGTIGFYGYNSQGDKEEGRYGIEAVWDDKLRGREGKINEERDAVGRWIPIGGRQVEEAVDGSNLILTIDSNIQYETERMLRRAMIKHQAEKGLVIVMDVKTGRILALAGQPSFNPNDYSQIKPEDFWVFKNQAVNDTYECGSVFKTITMASGIDAGKVEPETTYYDSGKVSASGYTIQNSDLKVHGTQPMTFVLEESLNTGAIFVEQQLGNAKFKEYVEKFGLGQKTDVGLLGEVNGSIANLMDIRRDINFYTASFGQGISLTPLQLAGAYAALGNGGVLMKPQIIEKIIEPGGKEIEIQPQAIRQVVSPQTAEKINSMLEGVVIQGHGKKAFVPGYRIGGKTGTAQMASLTSRGYEEGITMGSFAGYGPIENPRFAILVRIEDPKDVQWAESSAGPLFGEVMKFLMDYYNVEPTKSISDEDIKLFESYHRPYWDINLDEEERKIKEQKEKDDQT